MPAWCLFTLWTTPLHAANLFTVNNSDGQGLGGNLLATPPGTCTSPIGGTGGNCSVRGAAAIRDWVSGAYSGGGEWSDLKEAQLPAGSNFFVNGLPVPVPVTGIPLPTNIGNSWIPDYCDRPSCGHLLRGDVVLTDEDGNGTPDRNRAEGFGWGVTSTNQNLANLSLGIPGNVSPPGLTRARVRLSLGDASHTDCEGYLADPNCTDGVITAPDPTRDPRFWGKCDPDRFTALGPLNGQLALDNCLWFFSSAPITNLILGTEEDLLDSDPLDPASRFSVRDTLPKQFVTKYTAALMPGQVFAQNFNVVYGFDTSDTTDVHRAIYLNEWRLSQADVGPSTYASSFLLQHKTEGRRRGFDQDRNLLPECVGVFPVPQECDGTSNSTMDPFWGRQFARNPDGSVQTDINGDPIVDWNRELEWRPGEPCDESCQASGVGSVRTILAAEQFTFQFAQEVEGFLLSCLGCGHPAPGPPQTITYEFAWPPIPTIAGIPHPAPSGTTVIPIQSGSP
jgi:hypothetical protein